MAITVGTDSYISLTDANTYMSNNYLSTSSELATWNALSNADREVLLKKATKKIDRQILRGVRATNTQVLEFPRAIRVTETLNEYPDVATIRNLSWVIETEVSQKVKDANVEEALFAVISGASANRRIALQQQGVKSYSLGDLSETFGGGFSSQNNLLSTNAKDLLSYYLTKSVRIC